MHTSDKGRCRLGAVFQGKNTAAQQTTDKMNTSDSDNNDCENPQGVHVVVVPYPTQGHINPMLRFARMLKAAVDLRLSVTVVTAEHALRRIRKAEHAVDLGMYAFADGLPPELNDWSDVVIRQSMCQHGPSSLRALLLERLRPRVTCIVYDTFLEWVAPLAHQLNLPCAAFWTQSCAVLSAYAEAHSHSESDSHALAVAALVGPLEGLGLGVGDLPSFLQPGQRGGFYERWYMEQMAALAHAGTLRWLLGNSFSQLEPHHARRVTEVMPVPFLTVGPLMPPGDDDDEAAAQMWRTAGKEECSAWLGRQRRGSVVYVSFGSLAAVGEAQMRELARALREMKVPFLWSARAASAEENAALAEAADSGTGIVVPWASQATILAHPAVGAFVSHCGWNSTMEAVAAGVPMVCVPQFSDQPTDAALVARVWRNGVVASRDAPHGDGDGDQERGSRLVSPPGIVPATEFVRCLRIVLDGDDGGYGECIRRNAAGLRNAAIAATARPTGTSWTNLVGFVSEVAGLSRLH